jgi:hypothetical protein
MAGRYNICIQHTQAGLLVCCERALKSVDERTIYTGGLHTGAGAFGKPPAREK